MVREVDNCRFISDSGDVVNVESIIVGQLIGHLYVQTAWIALVTVSTVQRQQHTTGLIHLRLPHTLTHTSTQHQVSK